MTESELVRQYLPKASGRTADFILWNCTAYPCCDLATVREHLAELAAKCQPVRGRGWLRKVYREAARIEREMYEMARAHSRESAPSADAVDPSAGIQERPTAREK